MSPDEAHGVPAPFPADNDFVFLRCPYGPHRPIVLPNRILTDKGYVEIGAEGAKLMDDEDMDPVAREIRDRGAAEKAAEQLARENLGLSPKVVEPAPDQVPAEPAAAGDVFQCQLCPKKFKEQRFLNSHMAKKHPETGK